MDMAWSEVAGQYGFVCNGCDDNCCKSLFFHHTHIETAYLIIGFNTLSTRVKAVVLERAEQYCDRLLLFSNAGRTLDIMCPLNENNQCLIYEYRPMICRLHGLPHELQHPGSTLKKKPGCSAGMAQFGSHTYVPFDRTRFYAQMAAIESAYRKSTRQEGRIKLTIAQMLTLGPSV